MKLRGKIKPRLPFKNDTNLPDFLLLSFAVYGYSV